MTKNVYFFHKHDCLACGRFAEHDWEILTQDPELQKYQFIKVEVGYIRGTYYPVPPQFEIYEFPAFALEDEHGITYIKPEEISHESVKKALLHVDQYNNPPPPPQFPTPQAQPSKPLSPLPETSSTSRGLNGQGKRPFPNRR